MVIVICGFIDTLHAVRFEEIKIDIAGMQNETDFLEILRRKKKTCESSIRKHLAIYRFVRYQDLYRIICTQERGDSKTMVARVSK